MATRGSSESRRCAAGSSVIQAGIVRRRSASWIANEGRGFSRTPTARKRCPTRGWNGYSTVMIGPLVFWTWPLPE